MFQRWNPVDNFTDTLLPTDRWPWSDVTGMNPQPLHSFQLPSRSWDWEGDWYVDQSCGGEPSQTGVRKCTYCKHTNRLSLFFASFCLAIFFYTFFCVYFKCFALLSVQKSLQDINSSIDILFVYRCGVSYISPALYELISCNHNIT